MKNWNRKDATIIRAVGAGDKPQLHYWENGTLSDVTKVRETKRENEPQEERGKRNYWTSWCIIKNHPVLPQSGTCSAPVRSVEWALFGQLTHPSLLIGISKEKTVLVEGKSHSPVLVREGLWMIPLPRQHRSWRKKLTAIMEEGATLCCQRLLFLQWGGVNSSQAQNSCIANWASLHIVPAGDTASCVVLPLHHSRREHPICLVCAIGL